MWLGPVDRSAGWRAIEQAVCVELGQRLLREDPAPVAVGFSGGGDSLALLIAADHWARSAGRRILALTVDHRLRAAGADWALWCRERALRLGVEHQTLVWRADKPLTGLAAAARQARHTLLATAARQAGAAVILLGHTADDRLEAQLMRDDGGTVPEPRTWSPSPVWPEGRGVFLLRPMLDLRRAAIRAALGARGDTWIDDPANIDLDQPRARARARLADGGAARPAGHGPQIDGLFAAVGLGVAGELVIPRIAVAAASGEAVRRLLGAALLCAAGTTQPARGKRLARLIAAIEAGGPFTATLAGARVEADANAIRIMSGGGGVGVLDQALRPGAPTVFDGRYELIVAACGLRLTRLSGRLARLGSAQRLALKSAPPAARAAAPAVIGPDGRLWRPTTDSAAGLSAHCLVLSRLAAACGVINDEATIRSWQNR